MINFLTLEDVNTCKYSNQGFWWYKLDTAVIDPVGDKEFTDVKVDFLRISKNRIGNYFNWVVKVDNSLFAKAGVMISSNMVVLPIIVGNTVYFDSVNMGSKPVVFLYMGIFDAENENIFNVLIEDNIELTLKQLKSPQTILYRPVNRSIISSVSRLLNQGFNFISESEINNMGYLFVKLLKTDFQFDCNQQLTLGKVNTVKLGALTDYKPNGDLIGEYTPTINIFFENTDTLIPATFDSTVNDYVFNIDLTDKQNEGKIRFYVNIDANEVINDSLTEVVLDCKFETINTFSKLQTLFRNGGVGRLGANITVTDDLTVTKSVYLIGNDRTLNMNAHKIVVPSDMTFKAENTQFTNGKNTIQQNTGSNVELTNCTFTNCTGLGSVIDCQITTGSLSETDDFTTTLTGCTITNSDTAILHGGDLTVTDCTVTGKIGLKEYPYFLYQTDGSAVLTSNQFSLTGDGVIDYDIEFNPCIFICGENALINSLNHTEWSKNNLMDFLGLQKNRSSIDVTYYYNLIEDYVHLNSSQGYCHTVSDTDYVFKTNITINRGE